MNNNDDPSKEDPNQGINDNTGILNINKVRPEIEKVINNILKKFFENNEFENQTKENKDTNHNQEFIDQICNEVFKDVYTQFNGFILVCTGHLFGKGNAAFFFNNYTLWDKKTDYYVTSLYTDKDETFYAYICLFIIAP